MAFLGGIIGVYQGGRLQRWGSFKRGEGGAAASAWVENDCLASQSSALFGGENRNIQVLGMCFGKLGVAIFLQN